MIEGQMSIFDYLPAKDKESEEDERLKERFESTGDSVYVNECELCDVVFGSLECFERRGYFTDSNRRLLRNKNGEFMRTDKGRTCHHEPRNLNFQCFESERTHEGAGVKFGKCPYFPEYDGVNHCGECPEYAFYYAQVEEIQRANRDLTLSEAHEEVKKLWGIKSAYAKEGAKK